MIWQCWLSRVFSEMKAQSSHPEREVCSHAFTLPNLHHSIFTRLQWTLFGPFSLGLKSQVWAGVRSVTGCNWVLLIHIPPLRSHFEFSISPYSLDSFHPFSLSLTWILQVRPGVRSVPGFSECCPTTLTSQFSLPHFHSASIAHMLQVRPGVRSVPGFSECCPTTLHLHTDCRVCQLWVFSLLNMRFFTLLFQVFLWPSKASDKRQFKWLKICKLKDSSALQQENLCTW